MCGLRLLKIMLYSITYTFWRIFYLFKLSKAPIIHYYKYTNFSFFLHLLKLFISSHTKMKRFPDTSESELQNRTISDLFIKRLLRSCTRRVRILYDITQKKSKIKFEPVEYYLSKTFCWKDSKFLIKLKFLTQSHFVCKTQL